MNDLSDAFKFFLMCCAIGIVIAIAVLPSVFYYINLIN